MAPQLFDGTQAWQRSIGAHRRTQRSFMKQRLGLVCILLAGWAAMCLDWRERRLMARQKGNPPRKWFKRIMHDRHACGGTDPEPGVERRDASLLMSEEPARCSLEAVPLYSRNV